MKQHSVDLRRANSSVLYNPQVVLIWSRRRQDRILLSESTVDSRQDHGCGDSPLWIGSAATWAVEKCKRGVIEKVLRPHWRGSTWGSQHN